jgi:hypothetical protein
VVTKHLDNNTKHPEVLIYYDFVNEIIDEEEDMLLAVESDLFAIDTIILPELEVLVMMSNTKIGTDVEISTNAKTDIDAKINIDAKTCNDAKIDIDTKIGTNMKISTNKLIFDSPHALGEILVDTTPTWIKV